MKTVITSEYEALFRQHFRLATLYAERIVGSAHEAEDIVQEVFIALLDVDFSQIRQKESYLYRCVRNAALDHLHARMKNRFYDINSKETVRLAAEENAPGDEQAMIEQIAAIYHRIEALPEQGRRIFKMTPLHHHFQKPGNAGIDALIQHPIRPVPESKIVTRFWIVSILLAALTFVTLKIR